MTKTVEEVRRAAFEAQMDKILCGEGYSDFSLASMMERGTQGQYYSSRIAGAWEGFNAGLDAVEINFPSHVSVNAGLGGALMSTIANEAIDSCRAAIEQTGLGLKIK